MSVVQPGITSKSVFEGEKPGVYGVADEIAQDVVTITDVGVDPFLFGVSTRGPNLSRS